MIDVLHRRTDALEGVWRTWADVGRSPTEAGWASASRCPGWSVAALYAHVGLFPHAVLDPPAVPAELSTAEPVTAVAILRGFNAPGGVAHELAATVADAAASTAARRDGPALVAPFAEVGPRAVAALRGRAATATVPWPGTGAVTTWVEALRIVLMESVVHLLDVLDALGRPAAGVPEAALTEAVRVLAEIADPVGFVEAATGRSARSPLPVLR